ncbi:MAG: DUF4157 domain-containing protein [Rhizobacter sp.]|nr:DUF4157 domain-containing protein [Rhizobacter sp.]
MSGDLTHAPTAPADKAAMSFGTTLRLQRKCACGGGQCDSCSKKKKGLQAKLEVGASDDRFEQEADRAAAQVMNGGHADHTPAAPMQLQRVSNGSSGLGEAPAEVQQVLGSAGSPLDTGTRSFFESRFGHDFSRVRVHSDAQAGASASAVGAKAYTVGSNVVFGAGHYAPQSHAGRELMAHELAHVVQQGHGGARLQRKPKPACVETEAYTPPKDQKAKVLSNEEIAKDVARRNALDTVGEIGVRVFASASWAKKEKPRDIAAGTEVTVSATVKPATLCKGTGAFHPTGSGFYKIQWGGESGYVFSPVLDEVRAPAKPLLKLDLKPQICMAPDSLLKKKPIDYNRIGQQANLDLDQGLTVMPPKAKQTLEGALGGDLERAMKIWGNEAPPPVYSIPLRMGLRDAREEIKRQARENVFLIPPWADIQFYAVPDLMPFERTMVIVVPFPVKLQSFQEVLLVPSRESALAKYFDPKVNQDLIKATDRSDAKRLAHITAMLETLDRLGPDARGRFDAKALGKMIDWAGFESDLDSHVKREQGIARLMAAKPRRTTGTDLDAIVNEQTGVEPETEAIGTQRDAMFTEQGSRKKKRAAWEEKGEARARELQDSVLAHVDFEEQKNMLMDVFSMGFMAGAQYEIPPDDWGLFADSVSKEPGAFSGGIALGLLPGAWDGVVEAFKGLIDLAELVAKLGFEVTAGPIVDLYKYLKDKEKFEAEEKAKSEALQATASIAAAAVWQAFKAFVDNPAFLSKPAFGIGEVVGRGLGKTLHDQLLSPDVNASDKGYVVGKVIGRVIIEVVMLVFAPEELLFKGGAKTGIEATKAAKAMEGLASEVPALRKLLELKNLRSGARVAEESTGARKFKTAVHGAEETTDALRAGDKARDASKAEAAAGKALPEKKAAGAADELGQAGSKASKVHAKEPLNDGHHLEVTDEGICLCSPPPCPQMRKTFANELKEYPQLDLKLTAIEEARLKDPLAAAKEAEEVYDELKRLKKLESVRAKYRRNPEKLRKDFKHEVGDDPSLGEAIDEAVRSYQRDKEVSNGELDDLLGRLEEAREAGRPGRAPKVDPYFKDMDQLSKRARKNGSKTSDEIEKARTELAQGVQHRMPEGTKVKVVNTERTAAGDAQGAAASRGADLPNPDIDYAIDLPDDMRKRVGLPKRNPKKPTTGIFKPDDIRFSGKDHEKFMFLDHKEVLTKWEASWFSSPEARIVLKDMVGRDARIAKVMGPNCQGFGYTTNSDEMARLLNDLIVEAGDGALQRVTKVTR